MKSFFPKRLQIRTEMFPGLPKSSVSAWLVSMMQIW